MEHTQDNNQEHGQRKVAGFDKAILTYRQILAEGKSGSVLSKRKEEYVAFVKRVVFNDEEDGVVTPPDLHIQNQVVERMKDLY